MHTTVHALHMGHYSHSLEQERKNQKDTSFTLPDTGRRF